MNIDRILEKKKIFEQEKNSIDAITISSYEKDFELTFIHNSTALAGNTLTLEETKVLLEEEQLDNYVKMINGGNNIHGTQ